MVLSVFWRMRILRAAQSKRVGGRVWGSYVRIWQTRSYDVRGVGLCGRSRGSMGVNPSEGKPRPDARRRCWVGVAGGWGIRSHPNPHGAAAGTRVAGAGGRSMPTWRSPRGSSTAHEGRGVVHGSCMGPCDRSLPRGISCAIDTQPCSQGQMLLAETVHAVQAQGGVSTVSARHGIECGVSSTGTYARFGELHGMPSLYARSGSTHCQAHCTTAW